MNILITGGAGYIGSILVQKLFAAKSNYKNNIFNGSIKNFGYYSHNIDFDKLIVYDNLMYKQVCLTDYCYRDDFEFVEADVRDQTKLLKYIDQSDIIIPLAAIVGFPACLKNPELAKQINFNQIDFIAKNAKNKKILFPNTNSGYGISENNIFCTEKSKLSPISIYGKTKCDAENILTEYNNSIIFRLATVFGVSPRMRLDLMVNDFVYKAFNDKYIVLFEKDFKRNFIHIQDVSLLFVSMINQFEKFKGEIFNVGLSSANLSKYELCLKIQEHIKDFIIKYDDFMHDIDKRNYIVSNEKLEKIGWTPYYNLEMGIKELIKAYSIISNNNKKYTNL